MMRESRPPAWAAAVVLAGAACLSVALLAPGCHMRAATTSETGPAPSQLTGSLAAADINSTPAGPPPKNPVLKWQYGGGMSLQGVPAIARDGTIYVLSSDTGLNAFSPAGERLWWVDMQPPAGASPLVLPDGRVAVVSGKSEVCAVMPDGSVSWRATVEVPEAGEHSGLNGLLAYAPDGRLCLASYDGTAVCLRPDGSEAWRWSAGSKLVMWGDIAFRSDGDVLLSLAAQRATGPELHSMIAAIGPDGQVAWRGDNLQSGRLQAAADGSAIVCGRGKLSMAGPDGAATGIDIAVGDTAAIAPDGRALRIAKTGRVTCVDESGAELWAAELGYAPDQEHSVWSVNRVASAAGDGTFVAAAGRQHWIAGPKGGQVAAYPGEYEGHVLAFAADGSELWRIPVSAAAGVPAIGPDGTVYVVVGGRALCAIGEGGPGTTVAAKLGSPELDTGTNAPTVMWRVELRRWTRTPPCVGPDGTVYAFEDEMNKPRMVAVSPNGNVKWRHSFGMIHPSAPRFAAAGTMWLLDGQRLERMDPATGETRELPGPVNGYHGPWNVAPSGTIYVSRRDRLCAMDPDGSVLWRANTELGPASALVVAPDGTVLYVAEKGPGNGQEREHYAVGLAPTGATLYEIRLPARPIQGPLPGPEGSVYVVLEDCAVWRIERDGEVSWRSEYPKRPGPLYDVNAATETETGSLLIRRPEELIAVGPDGQDLWRRGEEQGLWDWSCALRRNGLTYTVGVYGKSSRHYITAFRPDGSVKWRMNPPDGPVSPVAAGPEGMLYAVVGDELVAWREQDEQR